MDLYQLRNDKNEYSVKLNLIHKVAISRAKLRGFNVCVYNPHPYPYPLERGRASWEESTRPLKKWQGRKVRSPKKGQVGESTHPLEEGGFNNITLQGPWSRARKHAPQAPDSKSTAPLRRARTFCIF